jgi:hypothetical protein
MSRKAIAAFLNQVAEDGNLRQALVEFAERHGFRFTPSELREVDLRSLSGSITSAGSTEPASLDELDDDSEDPGFGIIEYPA